MNDPATVQSEYASEERFLARRLATWAELEGPLVEDATVDYRHGVFVARKP